MQWTDKTESENSERYWGLSRDGENEACSVFFSGGTNDEFIWVSLLSINGKRRCARRPNPDRIELLLCRTCSSR